MKYIVLDSFKAQTRQGETELQAGQVITLPHETAIRLLNEGRIMPVEKTAYRIYSELLQTHLWVCETDHDMHSLRAEGVAEPIYTNPEIKELKKLSRDNLKAIHEVKTIFEKAQVKDVKVND